MDVHYTQNVYFKAYTWCPKTIIFLIKAQMILEELKKKVPSFKLLCNQDSYNFCSNKQCTNS